ncbi:MAG: PilZ domain-containing protein [Nitrospira sp.]|nr:PilZ domain-containing protein [Nitrospira sp.]
MYRRVQRECDGCILTATTVSRCRISDVSLNGCRIQSDREFAPGSFVMVRIWVPGVKEPIDIDQAVIRWERHGEIGLQIVALSNGADFQLARYVECSLSSARKAAPPVREQGWISGDGAGIPAHAHGAGQRAEA